MKRNPWVQGRRKSDEEINAEIQAFLDNGGEIIKIPEGHGKIKPKSETAVKIGKVHRQLAACKKKK